jgi:exopolyphosphatase/guanosine-5'-triphosphate,3'-diphosphate pyrophosphatase
MVISSPRFWSPSSGQTFRKRSAGLSSVAESTTKRVAGIDIGSNTTRVMIADVTVDTDGVTTHKRHLVRTWVTRLAEDVDKRGILLPQAIARTRNALTEAKQLMRAERAVFGLATATSAVRDADNGEAFLGEVDYTYGYRTILASGEEEAALAFAGVTSDSSMQQLAAEFPIVVIDVGGGSTETILASLGHVQHRHSFQLGSVRVTERCLNPDGSPPDPAQLEQARELVAVQFVDHFGLDVSLASEFDPPQRAIAVAGTATTVIAIRESLHDYSRDRVHGSLLKRQEITDCINHLAALELTERSQVVGLHPDRAPVILGGLLVLEGMLIGFGLSECVVSDSDILDGIALEAGRIAIAEDISELPESFGRASC